MFVEDRLVQLMLVQLILVHFMPRRQRSRAGAGFAKRQRRAFRVIGLRQPLEAKSAAFAGPWLLSRAQELPDISKWRKAGIHFSNRAPGAWPGALAFRPQSF
jgi:hypothetical protein